MDSTTLVVVLSLIDAKSVCVFLAPPVDGKKYCPLTNPSPANSRHHHHHTARRRRCCEKEEEDEEDVAIKPPSSLLLRPSGSSSQEKEGEGEGEERKESASNDDEKICSWWRGGRGRLWENAIHGRGGLAKTWLVFLLHSRENSAAPMYGEVATLRDAPFFSRRTATKEWKHISSLCSVDECSEWTRRESSSTQQDVPNVL